MEYMNSADSNLVSDEIQIDLNMLGALMLNRIGRKIDSTDVVAVDECGLLNGVVKLLE
jgi:nucleoside-triphosphatase THEP1